MTEIEQFLLVLVGLAAAAMLWHGGSLLLGWADDRRRGDEAIEVIAVVCAPGVDVSEYEGLPVFRLGVVSPGEVVVYQGDAQGVVGALAALVEEERRRWLAFLATPDAIEALRSWGK